MRNQQWTARELAEQLVGLAQRIGDSALLVAARFALGDSLFALGDFVPCREQFEQGISLYHPQSHRAFAFQYGQDVGITCTAQGAVCLWFLGYPEQSLAWTQKAIALAHDPLHPFSAAYALDWAAVVHQFRNETLMVRERAEAGRLLSREHEFTFWLAFSTILSGWALSQQEEQDQGIAQMLAGLAAWQKEGSEVLRPYALALLADVYSKAKRPEDGLAVVAEALSLSGAKC